MVRIPKTDATPPAAMLEVEGGTEPMRLAVGEGTRLVELHEGDSLVLTATAQDDGGIKDMTLQGNAQVTCRDPANGSSFTRTTGFLRHHMPGSANRSIAPMREDSRFVLRGGDIAKLCPGGHLESAVGQARVQASNFHGGGAATPRLEFRVSLSEVAASAIPMPSHPVPSASKATASAARTASASQDPAATGFATEPGVGGSGGPVPAPPAPRMCPRASAPGHRAESPATGIEPECLDAPVPSVVPPSGSAPTGAAPRGTHAAQRSQIRRI